MDDLNSDLIQNKLMDLERNRIDFNRNFGMVFDHNFSGPVHHWSKSCDFCGQIYGKHVQQEIKETIISLESACYCDENSACIPCHAIDMFKRIIGEV